MSLHNRYRPAKIGMFPRPFFVGRLLHGTAHTSELNVLVDTGSTVTIFPLALLQQLEMTVRDLTWHDQAGRRMAVTWRGKNYSRGVANVTIELTDDSGHRLAGRARVSFCQAPLDYALLGDEGGLEFLDATFRSRRQLVELIPNEHFAEVAVTPSE